MGSTQDKRSRKLTHNKEPPLRRKTRGLSPEATTARVERASRKRKTVPAESARLVRSLD